MSDTQYTRRWALRRLRWLVAASPLLRAQEEAIPPIDELVNVFEVEDAARHKLPRAVYDRIAAGAANRKQFDRITFRPRMLVNVREMDLTTELFGQKMFAPILVGPTSRQQRAHPEGELATARGAASAKAVMVLSSRSSYPIDQIGSQTDGLLWFQVFPDVDASSTRDRVKRAIQAGSKAVCLTVDAPKTSRPRMSWDILKQIRDWSTVPVLIKGILSAEEAQAAVQHGASGIVISNHGGRSVDGLPSTIEMLPAIAKVVGNRVPILIDGGFRRGTDILKALALGARAVLLGRPPLWGLAAFGADGVQRVVEMLQTELALAMGLCGKRTIAAIDGTLVKIDRR